MAKHMFPPRGYNQMEYPLPHNFNYEFELSPETATINSTIVPIIHVYEAMNPVDAIEVNPSHSSFAEETGSLVFPDSIIPKINISMTAQFTQVMDETDKIRYIKFNWMPIYFSFINMYTAQDNRTDVNVQSILEMQNTFSGKDGTPLYNGTDLTTGTMPMSTVGQTETFGIKDLTTDTKMEGVDFDEELMWDALSYYSNKGMLKKAMGQWHTEVVDVRRPWRYTSNNFTNPIVKRGNEYTFCGILIHMPLVDTPQQYYSAGDITTGSGLRFDIQVRYNQWNSQFDQTAF